MRRVSLCLLAAVVSLVGRTPSQEGSDRPPLPAPGAAARAVDRVPLPGSRPGTERWLVHFAQRSFDLEGLRAATLARKPAADIEAIVAALDRRARSDQADFAREVERLGGRVLAHWWLVNGCAIEVPTGAVPAVRAFRNVARLEPDALAMPALQNATNALNHGADAVHAAGFKGEGVTVAVMDGGFDVDMDGLGRPHRTFYPDGNPNNRTGGGIGGSRLLVCRQLGAMTPDTVADHGTQVACCAAGGHWGTANADHGHAYGAKLAGYAIADGTNGNASFTTMTAAWQTIAADRGALNIVAACNSYQSTGGGLHDPLNMVQQALDAAAYASDILVTAVAGNGGAAAAVGQSAANGIVAAAVRLDTHRVGEVSGRGPHAYDPQRFWPDLSATGFDMMVPLPDCESSSGSAAQGTSYAAPQICGAGALLRAANRNLRADETKAILLASALDISARNPDPPYDTRNAYGMGLLRDDVALATLRAGRHGQARLPAANPRHTFGLAVTGGTQYALAITWHRQVTTSTAWSNLDLRVLDGTTEVAASATPRNLYEMVRFRAARTANYTVEVTASSVEGAWQDFAFALAESLQLPPAGRYETFAAGCNGSGGNGVPGPVCAGANVDASTTSGQRMGENTELVLRETTTTALTVTGFSLLTRSALPVPIPLDVVLYRTDAQGLPLAQPVASAPATVGTQVAWYGAAFPAPVQIPASTSYCVGWRMGAGTILAPNPGTVVDPRVRFRRRLFCTQAWETQAGSFFHAYRVHCAGPGAAGMPPVLANDGVPAPGRTFTLRVGHARSNGLAILLTGVSRTQWGNIALPVDLGPFGAPGCQLRVAGDISLPLGLDASGRAALPLSLPNDTWLLGQVLYQQFLATDAVNALGLVASNACQATVGLVP